MSRRIPASAAFLLVCLLASLLPVAARASTRVDEIPVVAGHATWLTYLSITPAGSELLDVRFVVTYDNRGTGFDAAGAAFQLNNLSTGPSWTVTGAQLGWSGEGIFQAVRSTSAFDGPLEEWTWWETLTTSAPGNLDGEFRLLIDLPWEPPDRPDIPGSP